MRLSLKEIESIKKAILSMDPTAKIFLFGSRVDSEAKGGDIDLLIFSQQLNNQDRLSIKREIFKTLDEQKIDMIIVADDSDPFVKIALEKAKIL